MIWFFTPYSFNRVMWEAWENYMNLVPDKNDWVCMLDGDTAFLLPDFGHRLQEYIQKYPNTGLFTCYASRTSNPDQSLNGKMSEDPDIIHHRIIAEECQANFHLKIKPIHKAYGHLMMIKKDTWNKILPKARKYSANQNLYGTDTGISKAVRTSGLKIVVMEGIYIFHYFRMKDKSNAHII